MFSVDTEEEARELLIATCPTNSRGEFIAPELAIMDDSRCLTGGDRGDSRLPRSAV